MSRSVASPDERRAGMGVALVKYCCSGGRPYISVVERIRLGFPHHVNERKILEYALPVYSSDCWMGFILFPLTPGPLPGERENRPPSLGHTRDGVCQAIVR